MQSKISPAWRGAICRVFALALLTLSTLASVTTTPTLAATLYVAKTGADTPSCGKNTGYPCLTIQYTLDAIAHKNDFILVSPGTYNEALTISKNIRLSGITAHAVTLNAMGANTAVVVGSGVTTELEYMTITGGFQGADAFFPVGGISNGGTLALYAVNVTGNEADPDPSEPQPGYGGILNEGTLEIYSSAITGNSVSGGCNDVGGIENDGTVFMDYSTLSGNTVNGAGSCSAGPGGIIGSTDGLFSLGPVTIDTSLISGNTIAINGGSLTITRSTLSGSGTALTLYQPATLVNSTVSGNGTGIAMVAGFYGYNGSVSLYNSTVSNNSVGVSGSSPGSYVSLQNSILGGNGTDCDGGELFGSYSIIQNDSGCTPLGLSDDLVGVSPKLGPLRYNGGPTPTMMPLVGSPAINAGTPTGCTDQNGKPLTTDQRVLPRSSGGACDIGAVEVQPHDPGRY